MLIVKVQTKARQEKVETLGPQTYKVWVSAAPVKNAANRRVLALLADFLDLPKSYLKIVSGEHSRTKLIELVER